MAKYIVRINYPEWWSYEYEVEAENEDEAIKKADGGEGNQIDVRFESSTDAQSEIISVNRKE